MSTDLIAIANAELANKLKRQTQKPEAAAQESAATESSEETKTFKQDIWQAVYALNLMRYVLSLSLLILITLPYINPKWQPLGVLTHSRLFLAANCVLLLSAVMFTYLSWRKKLSFNWVILAQFSLDVVLATILTHAGGSIESSFAFIFFVVVATGSVVLPRIQAVGLASAAIIFMFYEHFYSVWESIHGIEPNYGLMAWYGTILIISSLLISYLAERIRLAELRRFIPGDQSIEEFLVQEEKSALREALEKTNGNKTEAAKLLGMSFRSFRYKVTKYDI
ncbi:MAG: helix-turn-helix domain-containing protein [Arenicella sp.]|nr:helix-turn-helix domain-containing protein [Arenicella sp.]